MDTNINRDLNNDLSRCLQSLDSSKIKERKLKREEIKELLENDEVIKILNYNSMQQLQHAQNIDGHKFLVTWKSLLNCCHRSLILDVEKEMNKQKSQGANNKPIGSENCSILLKNIINKANKDQPYLPCDDFLKCILDVSRNDIYQFFMGEIYYKILEQNILSQSYYWPHLSEHWNELFSLAYELYTANFANMKHISIKLMKHVVLRGVAHSNATLIIKKKIFSYLTQAITDTLQVNSDISLREDLIILSLIVCEAIGVECRKSLCRFIEENCIHLINFYENDRLKKVQQTLYQMLTFFINIHHPKYVNFSHKVSYTYNDKLWNEQLYQVYEFVCREIKQVKNNSNPKFSTYISELAVTIFNIVYFNKLGTSSLLFDGYPAPKRKKLDVTVLIFVDNFTNLKTPEICSRLTIITKLLENHPFPLHENDYINLVQCITKYLNTYKDTDLTKYLINCCKVLIETDNIIKLFMTKLDQAAAFYKAVWTFVLKTILSHENPDSSHHLLQSLIVLKNWQNEMYTDVLKPYINKTVKMSDHSLKTLIVLFNTRGFCSVSLNKTNTCLLFDWLLPVKTEDELLTAWPSSQVDPYLLSEVVSLILTKPGINDSCVNYKNVKKISSNEFTDIYFYLALQDIPKVKSKIKPKCIELAQNKSSRQIVDENIFQRLIHFITKTMEIEEKPNIITLKLLFFLTNFLSFLECQFFQDEYNKFEVYISKYMEKLKNILCEQKDGINKLNNKEFVEVCSQFYKKLQFVDGQILNRILSHESNKFIVLKIYNISKLHDSINMFQVFDYDRLSEEQKLSIKANQVLLNTCLYNGQILCYQLTVLNTLIQDLENSEDSSFQSYYYFKFYSFLHIILNLDNLPIDMIIQVNKFIKQLAKYWCFHQEAFIQIIHLVQDELSIVNKNNLNTVCTSNILMIIWSLQKISTRKKCGPKMICALVDLLGHFASVNNGSFGCMWSINTSIVKPMSPENIIQYLNSPFIQVRISAIKYIKVMCNAYEKNPNTYIISYEEMFNIILQNIHEGFIVDSDISEEEREDEYTNRISSYLLCMQVLLISSSKYRKQSLFEIFQTVNDKKLNLNLVVNLLEGVANELKMKSYIEFLEHNLSFLLWKWHFKYSNFKEFPIQLFFCTTLEQFFDLYSHEIIPISIIKTDLDLLNSMEDLSKKIKDNFAVIFSYLLAIKVESGTFINHDEIKDFIENILGQEHFKELVKSQFPDILLNCIQMIVCNTEEPIVPIQINSNQFLKINNIFQESYVKSKIPLLTIMSKKQPSHIQLIVHKLFVNIFKKSTPELRYQSFYQYTYFMKILIDQLTEYRDLCDFLYFLVHQSVLSTITLINQNNFGTQHDVLEYLEWLLKNMQPILKLYSNQIQPLVTSTLKTLAKSQPTIQDTLSNLFNTLEKLNDKSIKSDINDEDKNSVHEDIVIFLSHQNENANSVQSLHNLKLMLKTKKEQLQNMYKDLLKIRGFSEDCIKSVLHRFICTLIQLTKSNDCEIQTLAASCLGILGPGDLSTLILQPEAEVLILDSNNSIEYCFIKQIVVMLLNYLSDNNISVMEASNKTLFKAIATQEGQCVYEELDKSIVYPFNNLQIDEADIELSFDIEQFNLLIDVKEIWCPENAIISYNDWIVKITKKLFETLQGFCKSLLPVAENKPMFCEQILPHIIYFLLVYKPPTRSVIYKYLNCFFFEHYEMKRKTSEKINNFFQASDENENNIYCNRSAVQCFLNVINFIRLQQKSPSQNILDINFLYVSKAAQFCSAHFSSILYLELWCEGEFKRLKKDHWSMAFNPVDVITEVLPKDGLLLQSILNEAYKNIGDSDAIEGCGSKFLLTLSSRTQYYQQLRKWDRVMENCDLQQITENISYEYLEAFSNSGLQNVAHIIASNNDSLKYDFCWQLSKWDLPDNGEKSFEALHYHALRYVYQNNIDKAMYVINKARSTIIESLSWTSLESTATIYTPLAKLKIIEDLEDFISTSNKNTLFEDWLKIKNLRTNDFVNTNKIISQRSILLDFCSDNRSGILRLNLAEVAQKNGWFQKAGQNLATVVSLQNNQKHTTLWAKVEEARLLWQRNDYHMARILLKYVVEELDNYEWPFLHSLALQLYGSWMKETKSETASDIIKKYFQKAINIVQLESVETEEECGLECRKVLCDAYKHLSQFTDTLYQQISKYIKTEDLQKRLHEVKGDKEKGRALVYSAKVTKNQKEMKAGTFLMNQSSLDENDISNMNLEKIKYLKFALQNYLQLMALDDESELSTYRVVSLWLENKENDDINSIVHKELEKNPSYKFIMVLPQLVAHLSVTHEHAFNKSLETFINRCAIEHPYHTIPIVYAVANSNIDQKYTQCKQSKNNIEESRVLAAKKLMSSWKKNTKINCIVINTEKLYEAFIHLAYSKFSCGQGQKVAISSDQPLLKIKKSDFHVYPALSLPLNKYGHYSDITCIDSFTNTFLNPGGVHQPKKIDCLCSDGLTRSILLKGNEDMRQDAVMQQVFVLMNRLLQSNKLTAKKKLNIRTYKVIPLSQQSGIAEWCEGTMSLSDYLVGKNSIQGAHEKYRPDDLLPIEARSVIKTSKDNRDSKFTRLKKYLHICEKLKPVFRYYFFEKFISPSTWFERRQAYIYSVATSSMVGYILGLGDRHVQNILIDNNTAELIHIDFGVAFEQGTLLTTPETVPFRLTRDIVDGMGICGIEGAFRKCCENTMFVLRENQDVILTVIEVLLYDPCYEWTLTEEKAAQLQNQSTIANSINNSVNEVNKLAERSLNKIRIKLCGMEEAGSAASINGQVNRLIQEARDPNNLSLLFHGWQAYL